MGHLVPCFVWLARTPKGDILGYTNLSLLIERREMAVIKCVRVLLHQHHKGVEDKENGVWSGLNQRGSLK